MTSYPLSRNADEQQLLMEQQHLQYMQLQHLQPFQTTESQLPVATSRIPGRAGGGGGSLSVSSPSSSCGRSQDSSYDMSNADGMGLEAAAQSNGVRGQRGGAADSDNEEVCWLCLAGEEEGLGQLVSPCRCPRACHRGCLSRWQLHCAGRQEEKLCRFCGDQLPDWRHVPPAGFKVEGTAAPPPAAVEAPPAYMRISYNGRSHKIRVRPGPDGTRQFIEDCRQLLRIPSHLEFDVVFHCKEPATQSDLRFRGLDAFDAAVYCASLANHAAALQQQQQLQPSPLQPLLQPQQPQQLPLPPAAPCPLPPPPPPPRALVRATSEVADELARMAAAASAEAAESTAIDAAAAAAAADTLEGTALYDMYYDTGASAQQQQEQEQQQQQLQWYSRFSQLTQDGSDGWPVSPALPAALEPGTGIAGLPSNGRGGDAGRSRGRSLGLSSSQGRTRRQRRADGLSNNILHMALPAPGDVAPDVSESYRGGLGIAGGGLSGAVSGGSTGTSGGSGGASSGMASLASIAAAVGSVLGAFRRCGSWEGA